MEVIIRDATPDDADHVAQLWVDLNHYILEYAPNYKYTDNAATGFSEYLRTLPKDPNGLLIVAELEGRLIGFIRGSIFTRAPSFVIRQQGKIWDLYVSEKYRRQGIGQKLVEQALRFFREKEMKFVEKVVSKLKMSNVET